MIPRSYLVPVVVAAAVRLAAASSSSNSKVATGVTYGFFDGGGSSNSRRDDSTTSASTTITTVMEETTTTSRVSDSSCTGFGCSEEPSNSHDEAQEQPMSNTNIAGSCTPVELELTTDGRPQDISFELVCNDYTVWTYPSALIPYEGPHGKLVVNACVFLHNKCCHFALHDSHGDGLAEGDYAYVALNVAEETVLHYDSLTNPPFTTLAHSFGNSCSSAATSSSASSSSSHHHSSSSSSSSVNITPKDIPQDVNCQTGMARPLNFRITLDEHPEDLSWFLVCSTDDGGGDDHEMTTVWDQPRGSLAGHVGQVAAEKACIPYESTCTFSIIDSQGDGLTAMTDGSGGGGYTLTLGVSLIDAYVNEPFQEKSYCIGKKCQRPSTTSANDIQEQKEEFQKELEQLEQEQQQEQEMLEKLQESSQTTQEEIDQLEKLEQSLEEEEAAQEQQQEEKHKPPASDDQVPGTQEEQDLMLLKEQEEEALTSLEEEEESFQCWLIAGLGIVGFLLVLVACTGYYMHGRIKSRRRDSGSMSASMMEAREALTLGRRSSSAKEALEIVKANSRGHGDLTTITDSEDTEDESTDDGMFVLDA